MEKKLNLINDEFIIENGVLKECKIDIDELEEKTVVLPEGVETIAEGAFYSLFGYDLQDYYRYGKCCDYYYDLKIILPSSIQVIEDESFLTINHEDHDDDDEYYIQDIPMVSVLLCFQNIETAKKVKNNTSYKKYVNNQLIN